MSVPAGPFAGRLLTEIAKVKGGLPAAAAEMGVKPHAIDGIASGATPSAVDLARVYQWLSERGELTPTEIADYHRMSAAAWSQATADDHAPPLDGEGREARAASPRRPTRAVGTVALLTTGIVAIILLTSLITVILTRSQDSSSASSAASAKAMPADSGAASPAQTQSSPVAATASSSPSPAAPVTASDTPSSTTLPMPSTTPVGTQISAYNNLELSADYAINFAAGGPPQPQQNTGSQDLLNENDGEFVSDTGALSVLAGLPVTFANCRDDTAYGSDLTDILPGTTVCYAGHGVIAAVTVVKSVSSNNVDYVLLDVRVWQDQS